MPPLTQHVCTRLVSKVFARTGALLALSGSAAFAQLNFGLDPTLSTWSQAVNTGDLFSGTYAISGSGTLYLGSNFVQPASTVLAYTGGGPFTFTVPATSSLRRSGGAGYTYVYDNVINNGTITVSGGNVQFQNGTTLTNGTGATTTVSGSGSSLFLYGLANSVNLVVDTNGTIVFAGASLTTANLGSISLASGGTVKITGTLNNTSATLTAPTGGTYTLAGGTITGGFIQFNPITFTSSGGIFRQHDAQRRHHAQQRRGPHAAQQRCSERQQHHQKRHALPRLQSHRARLQHLHLYGRQLLSKLHGRRTLHLHVADQCFSHSVRRGLHLRLRQPRQ